MVKELPCVFDFYTWFRFDWWQAAERGLRGDGFYVYEVGGKSPRTPLAGPLPSSEACIDFIFPLWADYLLKEHGVILNQQL